MHFYISNDIDFTEIYDKRGGFDFVIVSFPFLEGDAPRSTSYGAYIPQLIRFARASSHVADFNIIDEGSLTLAMDKCLQFSVKIKFVNRPFIHLEATLT